MLVSVVGSSLLKYKANALQTDGGYCTTANKRVQIAENLRYLPMGYFNENSLGAISSVTTNTIDKLSGVSTRVVKLVTEGLEQAGTQSSLLREVNTCVNQAEDILNLPTMDISGAELTPERHDPHTEDVRFSYERKPIINGITLDIPEKTTTAIVGPSGSGKTTLCHRLKTVRHADQILMVDKGQIVQRGTHEELMRAASSPDASRPQDGSCTSKKIIKPH